MWLAALGIALIGAQPVVMVADGPPRLNPSSTCHAATQVPNTSFQSCMDQEDKARADIVSQWSTFSVAARRFCIPADRALLSQSYVDLLTCLQLSGPWQPKNPDTEEHDPNLDIVPGERQP
jgi:hypothetical protein